MAAGEYSEEEVVIVGAGVAGLAVAVGLKRIGVRSVVLEKSHSLRATGAALSLSQNAWRALDALGVAGKLIPFYPPLQSYVYMPFPASLSLSLIRAARSYARVPGRRPGRTMGEQPGSHFHLLAMVTTVSWAERKPEREVTAVGERGWERDFAVGGGCRISEELGWGRCGPEVVSGARTAREGGTAPEWIEGSRDGCDGDGVSGGALAVGWLGVGVARR